LSSSLKILNDDSVFKSLGILFQYFEAQTLGQLYRQVTLQSPVFTVCVGAKRSNSEVHEKIIGVSPPRLPRPISSSSSMYTHDHRKPTPLLIDARGSGTSLIAHVFT